MRATDVNVQQPGHRVRPVRDDLGDDPGEICYGTDMPTAPVHYAIVGHDAASLIRSVERSVVAGALRPGDALPSVRALARQLELSPTTVAGAYRDLRQRGVLVSHDRSRTVVAHRPPLAVRLAPELPPGTIDLASGNPDLALLPDLGAPWSRVSPSHRLYGTEVRSPALDRLARQDLEEDAIPTDHLAIVGGGLDGIERVLEVHCRLGDPVAIEDPGYAGTLDLIRSLGLIPVPVTVDDAGMLPDALAAALQRGAGTVLQVPRAHNPTGAALTAERATRLRDVLAAFPDVLVVEDDHAGVISGAIYHRIVDGHARWATIRSVAKSLGPDLRVAVLAGDDDTVTRVLGRQRLGTGWVSHLLQDITAATWEAARTAGTLRHAAARYAERRQALVVQLRAEGVEAHGASGLNVWVPVPEEVQVVQGLASRGWAVQAGEAYRIATAPAIRITTAGLPVERVPELAADLAEVLDRRLGTRRG
jgi:DNA-binding transcriptional MocR family regulator